MNSEVLRQDKRRAQVAFDMAIPRTARRTFNGVVFKDRRIVNQARQRPAKTISRPPDKAPSLAPNARQRL